MASVGISEREAYEYIKRKAEKYLEERKNARGARFYVAKTAIKLFLAGLPASVISYFSPERRGDLFYVPMIGAGGRPIEYIVTPEEAEEIKSLIEILRYYYSEDSVVFWLREERKRFQLTSGLWRLTHADVYELKLHILGLGGFPRKRYASERLEYVLRTIKEIMDSEQSPRQE